MGELKRALVICAHSDDHAFGAGGTIAKMAREGVEVRTFVCSFGEQSHPHLQEKEIRTMRVQEGKKANAVLGCTVLYLGMKESQFYEDFLERGWREKLGRHIEEFKPQAVFTHSSDDPHPDHRAAHRIAMRLVDDMQPPCEAYTFDVWNLFNTKRRDPKLIVDISKTFSRKLDSLSAFRSQRVALITLLWSVYAKAIYNGYRVGTRYAEVFYKVR